MNFDMSALQQSDVVSMSLVVSLRPEKKHRHTNSSSHSLTRHSGWTKITPRELFPSHQRTDSHNQTALETHVINSVNNSKLRSRRLTRTLNGRIVLKPSSSHRGVKRKNERRRKKNNRKRRRKRGRKIKIVVRHLDPNNNRKKRMAMKKVMFKKRVVVNIALPSQLLQQKASGENGVMTLFVTCKRCEDTALLEQVYRRRRGSRRKRGKSLNPNRPYLELNRKEKSQNG